MSTLGHSGRILRVDLTRATLEAETLDEEVWRRYPGGALLATRILLAETPAGLDPLGADSLLIFVSGAVAGHAAVGLPRFSVVGKSPLTGGIGEARCEGPFAIALKSTGFDAIVVRGRAAAPTALTITDGRPALRASPELWGLDASDTVDRLTAELGECHVACIGPAGERLVRYASIVSDRSFAAARMGLGAVMGAKLLKAVVVRGGAAPALADPDALDALTRSYAERIDGNPLTRWQRDPPGFGAWVGTVSMPGYLGVENYRTSQFAHADGYVPAAFEQHLAWSSGGCPGCPNDCIKGFAASAADADLDRTRSRRGGGLHQEAVAALGPNLGLPRVETPLRLNDRCLRLGLDPVSLGFTLSFAMEAREHGLLGPAELDGMELRFGAETEVEEMVGRIARREGVGEQLGEGVRRFAAELHPDAARFALHVKGLEMVSFDPRSQVGLALGYATAAVGPRYDILEHDWDFDDSDPAWPQTLDLSRTLGILRRMPMQMPTADKLRAVHVLGNLWSGLDALGVCLYASAPTRLLSLEDVAALVRAVTGWETSGYEVLRWGERRNHLMRIYNLREGLTAADDRLPDRFHDDPIDAGRLAGVRLDRTAFAAMVQGYYELMGWDHDGVPTAATRYDHDLGWTLPEEERGWPRTRTAV